MIELRGSSYDEPALKRYFGDPSCVCGTRRYELREGRAEGVRLTEVRTGSGLVFEVNESRGMDLGRVSFCGVPVSYQSYDGEVHPRYFEPFADGWLRSYAGGLLVTCGLTAIGTPGEDRGEVLPLHGRISNIPASNVCVEERVGDDGAREMSVSGTVRESKALSHNLVLRRRVTARAGESRILIDDEIANEGFEDQELMLLYHFNFGHPVIAEGARLLAHSASVEPRDEAARVQEEQHESHDEYPAPTPHYGDIVYYHRIAGEGPDGAGPATTAIVNERAGFGAYLRFDTRELDCFTQWKFCGEGNYVAGMEPGNAFVNGRAAEREAGRVKTLASQETKRVHLEVGVLASAEDIECYRRESGF